MTPLGLKERIRRRRKVLFACVLVATAALVFHVSIVMGVSWPRALSSVLSNMVGWAVVWFFAARAQTRRTKAFDAQGLMVLHIRYPGSRPGSLDDLWAVGSARCDPGKIVFQETMAGTDVPLGKPKTLDVVEVTERLQPVDRNRHGQPPPGREILRLALVNGEVEIAAEPAALAKMEQEVFGTEP